jgi:hypothetical protein
MPAGTQPSVMESRQKRSRRSADIAAVGAALEQAPAAGAAVVDGGSNAPKHPAQLYVIR